MSSQGSPLEQLRGRASQLFRAGRYDEAAENYRTVLQMSPSDFDAVHHLGVISIQTGKLPEARRLLQAAIDLSPANPEAWLHYGMSLQHLGRVDESVTAYERALNLRSDYTDAMFCLAVTQKNAGRRTQALTAINRFIALRSDQYPAFLHRGDLLRDEGNVAAALADYESALTINPDYFDGWLHRGALLAEQARGEEALQCYDKAAAIAPDRGDVWYNRGVALQDLGREAEALAAYERAVQLAPDWADAWNNRGALLRKQGRKEEALESFNQALKLVPDHIQSLGNQGMLLVELNRSQDALASFDRALAAAPDAKTWYNRGIALHDLGQGNEALASYDAAVKLDPNLPEAWNNRGNLLSAAGRLEEALLSFRRALMLDPRQPDFLASHGGCLQQLKRFEEGAREFRKLELVAPEHKYLLSGLLLSAAALCDWKVLDDLEERLKNDVVTGKAIVPPLPLMGCLDNPGLHRVAAEHYLFDTVGKPGRVPTPKPVLHDRVRLAYVSNDFYTHATARLMADLFERHDRKKFEVIAISFGPDEKSDIRERLLKSFDQFHDVRGLSDSDVAELMRKLEIDIAIDLKGYTGGARPGIFAHRSVPVTVSYLGYPGTLGAAFMDYVIADKVALPSDQQPLYAEKIVHLPGSYQANDPGRVVGPMPTRAEAGLPEQGFVFCRFNNHWKITKPAFESWMRILKSVPDSVLWLLSDSADANLARAAEAQGVDPKRLIFAPRLDHASHLGRLSLAGLLLDTRPYNAHTTASDALWTGVPVLTLPGKSFASRVAASLNTALGLPELIAKDEAGYEALAMTLATDAKKHKALKTKLAKNRATKPLFDAPAFCKAIEAAFLTMLEQAGRGEAPQPFAVSPD